MISAFAQGNLPFRLTPGASEHIRQWSWPKRSLRATLSIAYGFEEADEDGNITAKCDWEHLKVGYLRPRHVAGWTRYEIGGHTIAIAPYTLARLKGKRLKLRKTPGHSAIWPHVLVAV